MCVLFCDYFTSPELSQLCSVYLELLIFNQPHTSLLSYASQTLQLLVYLRVIRYGSDATEEMGG